MLASAVHSCVPVHHAITAAYYCHWWSVACAKHCKEAWTSVDCITYEDASCSASYYKNSQTLSPYLVVPGMCAKCTATANEIPTCMGAVFTVLTPDKARQSFHARCTWQEAPGGRQASGRLQQASFTMNQSDMQQAHKCPPAEPDSEVSSSTSASTA